MFLASGAKPLLGSACQPGDSSYGFDLRNGGTEFGPAWALQSRRNRLGLPAKRTPPKCFRRALQESVQSCEGDFVPNRVLRWIPVNIQGQGQLLPQHGVGPSNVYLEARGIPKCDKRPLLAASRVLATCQ